LRTAIDHACSLTVLDGDDVVYLAHVMSAGGPSLRRHFVGARLPAHATSTGHVLLAALTTDERVFCWGRGIEGQLGSGMTSASAAPLAVATGIAEVATGFFFTCVRRTDGVVACTGENNAGQLGLGDQNRRATFTPQ